MEECPTDNCTGVKTRKILEEKSPSEKDVWAGFMERYPILFKQKDLPMTETCMCWGIECPPGWYDVVKDVCDKIETINNTVGKQFKFEIQATQVKEKFGTLRIYLAAYSLDIENMSDEDHNIMYTLEEICEDVVARAECQTENICKICGKPIYEGNRVVSKGWIGFYCKECADKKSVVPWENYPNN